MHALPRGYEPVGALIDIAGGSLQRVQFEQDGRSYWLKGFHAEYPSDATLRRIEAELRVSVVGDSILPALTRIDGERTCWVLYGDHAGSPLRLDGDWTVEAFFRVALGVAAALSDAHREGLLLGRLEPGSMLWDEASQSAALLGAVTRADCSTLRASSRSRYDAPEVLEAPEADVTPAADVYSLGLILDAIRPQVNGRIPEALVELLERMLSRSPADRPATAQVVLDELRACGSSGGGPRPRPSLPPDPSVGREREFEALTRLAASSDDGPGSMILVSGEPGIGKSSMLARLRSWAKSQGRPVAHGKFDQYKQGRPYSALLTALEGAIDLALAREEASYQRHRQRFASANRTLLAVLRSELPRLEHVMGSLPKPAQLGPSETDVRFKGAFRHLLDCLNEPARPLLLVLDDMQWADRATLDVLKDWQLSGLPERMALVCGYREGELGNQARDFLDSLDGVPRVRLLPLEAEAIFHLCSRLLPDTPELQELASAVHRQSRGNPLHALEMLKSVASGNGAHEGGDPHSRLRLINASDTVLDLMTLRLREFDDLTQATLIAASCAGPQFSSVLLSVALDEEARAVAGALRAAANAGVVWASPDAEDSYSFAHDRMQQAAFSLGSEPDKQAVRLRLGRHYLKGATTSRECLYGAVEHLNHVREALLAEERKELARLNWKAAFLAKESIAYERAVTLFRAFQEDERALNEEERFAAALALAECVFLTSTLEVAEVALGQALRTAPSPQREHVVMLTWQEICQHQQRYSAAIKILLNGLAQLGRSLPERPSIPRVLAGLARLLYRTRKLEPRTLAARADLATPEQRAELELLLMLWGPSLWTNQLLNGLVVIRMMTLTLRIGNAPGTAMAYVCFAVLNHVLLQRHERALEFAKLGVAALDDEGNASVATRVRFLSLTFFGAFERTPQENVACYERALQQCLARGELLASHLLDGIVTTLPCHGYSLGQGIAALSRYEREARQVRAESTLELVALVREWAGKLSEDVARPLADFPITFPSYIGVRGLLSMELEYLWEHDDQVLSIAESIRKDVVTRANPLHAATYGLFLVMAQCRGPRRLDRDGRRALKTLARFAAIYPPNFRSLLSLAQAEVTALEGRPELAIPAYRVAIAEASAAGHELFHALALERLACFHDLHGEREARDDCLRASTFAYARFGAQAKVDQLRSRYPDAEFQPSGASEPTAALVDLRLEAVMKAAWAIAEETSSERLAPTLVQIVATAAHAGRAVLLQRLGENWMTLSAWQLNTGDLLAKPLALDRCELLSHSVVRYATRTNQIVNVAGADDRFTDDPYFARVQPRSVLCVPVSHRGAVSAILYLENSLYSAMFTADQARLVSLLGTQAAIALSNSETHRLELESVQSRVNPHFLYNALSVVAELVATQPERAEGVILKLARLYRTMVNSSADRMVTLGQELELVRDYLELEQARFGAKLRVEWQVDGELYPASIPSLLLQPLVENAVHHGIRRKVGTGTVRVSAAKRESALHLSISDDGPGWYGGNGGSGFGLRSVEKRIKLVYGEGARLRIAHEGGVSVQLELPLPGSN